ncbi:MAG: rhamnogalacturonan lyase B N-terminal domain-containing protein [Luteolibacter sp.]
MKKPLLKSAFVARLLAPVIAAAAYLSGTPVANAAFGLTSSTDFYTVDTGAGLVFKVRRTDNGSSTQSPGDISSLVYNGVEYQDQSRGSQVNSGFDYLYSGVSAVSVSAAVLNTSYVKVTVTAGNLTHYYMARSGYANIYMGTYFTSEPNTLGLCRYILRLQVAKLPNGPTPSDIRNNTGAIESGDIFGLSNGQTRSKHYSNQRLRDWSYIGATGSGVGAWVVRDNNEGNSGGPFFRCLMNQCTSTNQEITYIVNYGEAQTEAFRFGILNSYTLVMNGGGAPATPDTSWFSGMGLTGYVASTARGRVTGVGIAGRDTAYTYTVGFANSKAQYWTPAAATNGYYSCAGMIPGTYTMTFYKNELAVWSGSVAVTAGGINQLNTITITGDPSSQAAIWRIGNWDGSPTEFRNGGNLTTMHPSDVRMSSWAPGTYTVGSSSNSGFPAYQWKDVNGSQVVSFNLTSGQVAAHTIRVGITCAYSGARPDITVNSWNSANQSASSQPSTRTLTVGTYRGNNTTYTFSVPASAFVTGTNTLTVFPISGSGSTGFLSAGYSIDCVDMY